MTQTKTLTLVHCARPAFLLLTPCCLSIAVAFAIAEGIELDPVNLILIFIGALSAHVSVNMLNEYHDYQSGLDLHTRRTPFSGGSGALPAYPDAAHAVLYSGLWCLLLTVLIGLYFLWQSGWGLLPIGSTGVLLVYFYSPQITRQPFLCLLAPGVGFGPLMIIGAYYLISGRYQPAVTISSSIMLFVASNLLLLNQFPDLEADREAGRLHLPILIGRKHAALVYVAFLIIAYALLLLTVYFKLLPVYSLLGLFTALLGLPAAVFVLKYHDDMTRLMPALALNVILSLTLPLLISLGLIWQRLL